MDKTEVGAMLDHDRAEWSALVAILESHPNESFHDPASPRWTSRDVYAHLARWMEVSTSRFESELAVHAHEGPIEGTDDEINARWQQEDSGLSLAEARGRASRVRAKNRGHRAGARRSVGRYAGQDRPHGRSGPLRGAPEFHRGPVTL